MEAAIHWPFGRVPGPRPEPLSCAVAALESAILPALRRTPCAVSFSGGRDSSLILGLAVRLARREGLPLPVACTYVYPEAPATQEAEWQELVIRHLRVPEWERIEIHDEFDLIGPVAQRLHADIGLAFPSLLHNRELMLDRCRGGALLSGEGGDEILRGSRAKVLALVVASRGRHSTLTPRSTLASLAPARRRYRSTYERYRAFWPWLQPAAAERAASVLAAEAASEPFTFGPHVWHTLDRRAHAMATTGRAQARRYDALSSEPLLDRTFAATWIRSWSRLGPDSRTSAMEFLGGDVLPAAVLRRFSKARFGGAYRTDITRAFAETWTGTGVDHSLVDAERLRDAWLAPKAHAGASMLLQQAFHASEAARSSSPAPNNT